MSLFSRRRPDHDPVGGGSASGTDPGDAPGSRDAVAFDAAARDDDTALVDGIEAFPADDDEEEDTYLTAAMLLARTPDPATGLAIVIVYLLQLGHLEPGDLDKLGVSPEELGVLVDAFHDGPSSVERLSFDLSVQAELREFNRQIDTVAADLGIAPGTPGMAELRETLAEFALDNDLDDIVIAYRLLRAEHPERLPAPGPD